jgi:hypothetical protein
MFRLSPLGHLDGAAAVLLHQNRCQFPDFAIVHVILTQ